MSSGFTLSEFLEENSVDVSVIVEHKLMSHSLYFMNSINIKYEVFSVADTSIDQYGPLKEGCLFFLRSVSARILVKQTVFKTNVY